MQRARPLDLLELAPDFGHAVADQAPVGLDLGFAGTAEEAEAAALALEVGPAADQPARLIVEMGELDLEPSLGGRRALAENLEDQPGPIDDLGPDLVLEVLLLHGRERRVDHQQARLMLPGKRRDLFDLALAEQGRGPDRAQAEGTLAGDDHADRLGQPLGLLGAGFSRAPRRLTGQLRNHDQGAFAARDLDRAVAVELIQAPIPLGRPRLARPRSRLSACSGWRVEIACL